MHISDKKKSSWLSSTDCTFLLAVSFNFFNKNSNQNKFTFSYRRHIKQKKIIENREKY